MTRKTAKRISLKVVRGWGHFLPSIGDNDNLNRIVAYAPYIPSYVTPNIVVGIDRAEPGTERMAVLMREIERRVSQVVGFDPVLSSMRAELQEHRARIERRTGRRAPDILCSRAQAAQIERAMMRYAEADVRLSEFYGRFTIET